MMGVDIMSMPRNYLEWCFFLTMLSIVYFNFRLVVYIYGWKLSKKKPKSASIATVKICHHCNGDGVDDYDTNGDPIDFCEHCSGWGKIVN